VEPSLVDSVSAEEGVDVVGVVVAAFEIQFQ
jgi:hypothetical protein